jgi:hypothetical protein
MRYKSGNPQPLRWRTFVEVVARRFGGSMRHAGPAQRSHEDCQASLKARTRRMPAGEVGSLQQPMIFVPPSHNDRRARNETPRLK